MNNTSKIIILILISFISHRLFTNSSMLFSSASRREHTHSTVSLRICILVVNTRPVCSNDHQSCHYSTCAMVLLKVVLMNEQIQYGLRICIHVCRFSLDELYLFLLYSWYKNDLQYVVRSIGVGALYH